MTFPKNLCNSKALMRVHISAKWLFALQ